jgi:hypothetical protein
VKRILPCCSDGVPPHRDAAVGSGLLLLLGLALVSCGRNETSPARQPVAQSVRQSAGVPGVVHVLDLETNEPWSIHIAKIDRSCDDLEIQSVKAQGKVRGLARLSDQVATVTAGSGRPVAAVNGDFYVTDGRSAYVGDPRGLQILHGEVISAPTDQDSFWIGRTGAPQVGHVESQFQVAWPDGSATPFGLNEERAPNRAVLYTPRMGASTGTASGGTEFILEHAGKGPWLPLRAGETYTARVKAVRRAGDAPLADDIMVLSVGPQLCLAPGGPSQVGPGSVVKISTATIPDLAGVRTAISGGSVLVQDGKREGMKVPITADYKFRSVFERHPRSAVGADDKFIYFVQVDGRQPRVSMGMTLSELGQYMHQLGCTLALSLDGGASSTFWLDGQVLNSPCHGREREIANGLVVVQKPKSTAQSNAARANSGG